MHPNPRRILPIVIILLAAAAGVWWYLAGRVTADTGALAASGTIEAVSVNISPELGGRVAAVAVDEGQSVKAGDVLVRFDTSLLDAQRRQAEAALAAAQANQAAAEAAHSAALANYNLLKSGASAEQLKVAQTVVDKAQVGVNAAQEAYDALPEAARDTANGKALNQQIEAAKATLANAQAQYDLAAAGARSEQLEAAQGQVDASAAQAQAAAAQASAAKAALEVLDVQIARLALSAPADGVVLSRAIQPGEVASPGATLLVLGRLDALDLTVYVAETEVGNIRLGQAARVSVDSYPGQTFTASVAHIADQAEFTPRNVQTAQGRKSTVFAVKLTIQNPDGKLKPGMPADVDFGK